MISLRQAANLLTAAAQIMVPALGAAGLLGRTVDAKYQTIETPLVPADYAFTVWSVIFLLSMIYAVDQARPSKVDDPLYRRVGWLTAAAFGANALWLVVAQLEISLLLTGIIFLVTFGTMIAALPTLFADGVDGRTYGWVRWAVGMLGAWVTVAIFANWSVILKDLGAGAIPGEQSQALILLSTASLVAVWVTVRTRAALPYVLVIAWALIGLIVADLEREFALVAAGAGAWLVAIVVLALFIRRRGTRPLRAEA